MQLAYPSHMEGESPRRARRREKLELLLTQIGGAAQAEEDTGTPRTHFVAMVKGRRGLGDDLALKLEEAYGKPSGWFDSDDSAYWPFSAELQQKVLALSTPEIERLEGVMRAHLGMSGNSAVFTAEHQNGSGAKAEVAYPVAQEVGTRALDQAELPEPRRHGKRGKDRGQQRGQGGGRA